MPLFLFFHGSTTARGPGRPHYLGFIITLDTPHMYDYSGGVINRTRTPVPNDTPHSQDRDIHGGIRTRNPSEQAAAERRPRPRGHRNPHMHV
jgi:hypothetical protein